MRWSTSARRSARRRRGRGLVAASAMSRRRLRIEGRGHSSRQTGDVPMPAIASLVRAAAILLQLMPCLMSGWTCCVLCIRCVRILVTDYMSLQLLQLSSGTRAHAKDAARDRHCIAGRVVRSRTCLAVCSPSFHTPQAVAEDGITLGLLPDEACKAAEEFGGSLCPEGPCQQNGRTSRGREQCQGWQPATHHTPLCSLGACLTWQAFQNVAEVPWLRKIPHPRG